MSIFKLTGVKPMQGGNWERIGHYLERIDSIKFSDPEGPQGQRIRKNVPALFVEKTIVRVIDNGMGAGHGVGEQVTHMYTVKPENRDTVLGGIKAMLMVLTGCKDEEAEGAMDLVSSPKQPLTGMLIEVHSQVITLQKSQRPFTQVRYLRSFTPQEAMAVLSKEEISRFFPNDYLQKQAVAMGSAAVAAPAAPAVMVPALAQAPVPTPVPQQGVLQKLAIGQTPPNYLPAPLGSVFATADGGRTWIFAPAS